MDDILDDADDILDYILVYILDDKDDILDDMGDSINSARYS